MSGQPWPYTARGQGSGSPSVQGNNYVHPGYGMHSGPQQHAPPHLVSRPSLPSRPPPMAPMQHARPPSGRLVPPMAGPPSLPPRSPQSQHFHSGPPSGRTPSPQPFRRLPPSPAPPAVQPHHQGVLNQQPHSNLTSRPSLPRRVSPNAGAVHAPPSSINTSFHQAASHLSPIVPTSATSGRHSPVQPSQGAFHQGYNNYPTQHAPVSFANGNVPHTHSPSPAHVPQSPTAPAPEKHAERLTVQNPDALSSQASGSRPPQPHQQQSRPTPQPISRPSEKNIRHSLVVHNPDAGPSRTPGPISPSIAFPSPRPAPVPMPHPQVQSQPTTPTTSTHSSVPPPSIAVISDNLDDLNINDPPPAYSLEAPPGERTALAP